MGGKRRLCRIALLVVDAWVGSRIDGVHCHVAAAIPALQNVRKLVDAASDTSLASACLGIAMDADMDPRLSPAMAGAWRLYRESDLEMVRALTCDGTIFKSGIRLVDLLMWASKYGSSTFLVLNHPEERSEVLRTHLVQVTTAVVGSGEPLPLVSDTVKRLWTEWFGALMPDLSAHGRCRLPMTAYAILVSDSLQPKANWPRQLQVHPHVVTPLGLFCWGAANMCGFAMASLRAFDGV